MLKQVLAFLKKDLLVESSYRFSFFFNLFGIAAGLLTYFFIDRLFGHRMAPHLEEFGVGYFSYVLLSLALFGYIGTGLSSFSARLRSEQMQGTLEAVVATPVEIPVLLLSFSLWNLILATLDLLIYLSAGIFLFKISFASVNPVSALIVLTLTIVSFASLGIISASFIMIFKRGNPLSWVIAGVEGLIGGVYFPVAVLPGWMQLVAKFFPITHAVRAMELAVYRGYSPAQLGEEIGFLFLFSCLLLPSSLALFKYSLDKAKKNGSLTQY